MNAFSLPKQDIMTFHLLMGTDGEKMSKTKPNCILIDDAPQVMYQKLINIRDDMIIHYFELATDATLEEVAEIQQKLDSGEHPNAIKNELAQRIIVMYHGKKYDPNDNSAIETQNIEIGDYTIADLLRISGFATTGGDIRNAISGGSVCVDGQKILDPKTLISFSKNGILLEMGKKKVKRIFIK